MRHSIVQIHKDEFSFSAGHFTIFSATDRESLHGHNYNVSAVFKFLLDENGLSFDYRHYKNIILNLCKELDRKFLLPKNSKFLQLTEEADYINATFNHKKMVFLKEDVIILPLSNITIEELAHWFVSRLAQENLQQHHIFGITIHVFNGPGQSSCSSWGEM